MFESLESRLHLSVTKEGTVLTVVGTDDAEVISFGRIANRVKVTVLGETAYWDAAEVTHIVVKGLGGDDNIQSFGFSSLGATIYGGRGGDLIGGGAGDDIIRGGPGSDQINGRDGNDKIYGGTGRDRLFGGEGLDELRGQRGADTLANDGVDLLIGGPGADSEIEPA